MTKERDPRLAALDRLAGTWTTEATHPAMPGVVVHGTAVFEWLEGERFLIQRYRTDHPDFPDAISILGFMGEDRVDDGSHGAAAAGGTAEMRMHYHDSRGVFRVLGTSIDGAEWRLWRNAPGFSQRRHLLRRRPHPLRPLGALPRRRALGRRPGDHLPAMRRPPPRPLSAASASLREAQSFYPSDPAR